MNWKKVRNKDELSLYILPQFHLLISTGANKTTVSLISYDAGSLVGWCGRDAGIAAEPDISSAAGHASINHHHNPRASVGYGRGTHFYGVFNIPGIDVKYMYSHWMSTIGVFIDDKSNFLRGLLRSYNQ